MNKKEIAKEFHETNVKSEYAIDQLRGRNNPASVNRAHEHGGIKRYGKNLIWRIMS